MLLSFIVVALFLPPDWYSNQRAELFARFTPPLPHPFIKSVLSAFIKILTLTAYLLTKEHKHTRAGYIEKHWMLITSNCIKNYKKYLLRGPAVSSLLLAAVRLQLTTFCPDRLQPFEVCSILSSVYHSGGFQKLLEASFYKAVKKSKTTCFFIKAQKIKKTICFFT